ncbi:MAG TPA: phenylalanine--tRNA ligase subunit alpha [Methanomassiliicoccales archaeon]|nr:phenylalanine--tRNA ligase subunit alpha [Methanomassiliicoccales archaeon]
MNASQVLDGLSNQEKRVLLTLQKTGEGTSPEKVLEAGGFAQLVEVMNAANWLQSKGLVAIEERSQRIYSLRARDIVERGLPERQAMRIMESKGGQVKMSELEAILGKGDVPIAIGWLRRKNLVSMEKAGDGTIISLTDAGKAALATEMEDEKVLRLLASSEKPEGELPAAVLAQLKGRQDLIAERTAVSRRMTLTPLGMEVLALGIEVKEEVAQLTPELIQSGKWREVSFRRYDVNTFAPTDYPAKKHPLTRIADEVRRIFVQMGFEEIDDEYVQPSFWNMDALFTPQDHPARDMQDTFYLKNPPRIAIDQEKELMERIKAVHENGGSTGSLGWRYKWSKEEAERALLRTHTTVNTIRYLAKHPDPPVKVFSLSRVFRKEAIDSTHLPEFVQIEGIVMEEHASFDMLVGILREFYKRMGFEQIRVRPGYFPYTEPSMEVEVMWHGKWMELGGAGVFRPEVTAPFGVKYPVLAWGQGFERLAMLRWGLKDIRDLYVTDVEMLRQSPIF